MVYFYTLKALKAFSVMWLSLGLFEVVEFFKPLRRSKSIMDNATDGLDHCDRVIGLEYIAAHIYS